MSGTGKAEDPAVGRFLEYQQQERLAAIEALKEYGSGTIRMAFLLNGGAVLALLTLVGAMFGGEDGARAQAAVAFAKDLRWSFALYGLGVLCAAASSGVAYMNWSALANTHLDPAETYLYSKSKWEDKPRWLYGVVTTTLWASVLLVAASLLLFGYSSWQVIGAIAELKLG